MLSHLIIDSHSGNWNGNGSLMMLKECKRNVEMTNEYDCIASYFIDAWKSKNKYGIPFGVEQNVFEICTTRFHVGKHEMHSSDSFTNTISFERWLHCKMPSQYISSFFFALVKS